MHQLLTKVPRSILGIGFVLALVLFFYIGAGKSTIPNNDVKWVQSLLECPVSGKGRVRPTYDTYQEFFQQPSILFQTPSIRFPNQLEISRGEFYFLLHFLGHNPFDKEPLFPLSSSLLKKIWNLKEDQQQLSYQVLLQKFFSDKILQEEALVPYIWQQWNQYKLSAHNSIFLKNLPIEARFENAGLYIYLTKPEPALEALDNKKIDPLTFTNQQKQLINDPDSIEEIDRLLTAINQWQEFTGPISIHQKGYEALAHELKNLGKFSSQSDAILDQQFPLNERLSGSPYSLKMLASKHYPQQDWLPLSAFHVTEWNIHALSLTPLRNFTAYSDEQFRKIKQAYVNFIVVLSQYAKTLLNPEAASSALNYEDLNQSSKGFANSLIEGYLSLEGKPYLMTPSKVLSYPSWNQLKVEMVYISYPWTEMALACYIIAISLIMYATRSNNRLILRLGIGLVFTAFFFHTLTLIFRAYILQRPPVSNMYETILYVPWIAFLVGSVIYILTHRMWALIIGALSSTLLLFILAVTKVSQSLDTLQPVLDSQFWLTVHVLMVVGSYGLFMLSGVAGHIFIIGYLLKKHITDWMIGLSHFIFQTMIIGLILLIPGTILGGIWAHQSWGRFWDWDPKESWAFITSCIYLAWIHAYCFRHIAAFGIAIGSVIGLMATSFTWYGVNYILGVGLHSYGFGQGGQGWYFGFLILETALLTYSLIRYQNNKKTNSYH